MKKPVCFHTYKNGVRHWQGRVIRSYKNVIRAQLFSWIDGRETNQVTIRKSELTWDSATLTGFVFYPTHAQFRYIGDNTDAYGKPYKSSQRYDRHDEP